MSTPADPAARVTSVKSVIQSKGELVDRLREAGMAKAAAQAVADRGWRGLAKADDENQHADRLADLIRTAARNLKGI